MNKWTQKTLDLAQQIQKIPAPTFSEKKRADWVRKYFQRHRLETILVDAAGNVYGRLPGRHAEARPIVVTAHLDTVFPEDTPLTCTQKGDRLYGPGLGDNSLGVAALLALIWRFSNKNLPCDLWLVANTAEEGVGDLKGMREVLAHIGNQPRAWLVLEGMGLGTVYHRGLHVLRYRISLHGPGGHSWGHYGRPSAIHALGELITALSSLPLPRQPRTTLNVGRIGGGTSVNTIAAEAWLELDLRSEEEATLAQLNGQVQNALTGLTQATGLQVKAEVISQRPGGEIPPSHPLVKAACQALERIGIAPQLAIGSTDANIPLAAGLPAVCIGLSRGGNAHTLEEYIEPTTLESGLEQLFWLITEVASWQEEKTAG